MSASLEHSGFNASGTIGDLGTSDTSQDAVDQGRRIANDPAGRQQPGRQNALARPGEADLTWLLAMKRRGCGDDLADHIVGQQDHPQFDADHLRRLASQVVQPQGVFEVTDVQLHVPPEAVEIRDGLGRVFLGVDQRGDDRKALDSLARLDPSSTRKQTPYD
mgnify:CR=1 FL=1